jgi:ATP-dependent Lon protease
MYVGFWLENINYVMGDIVYVAELLEYYICIKDHLSNNLTLPSKEDLYWLYISSTFLNNFRLRYPDEYKDQQEDQDQIQDQDIDDNSEDSNSSKRNNVPKLKIITKNLKNYKRIPTPSRVKSYSDDESKQNESGNELKRKLLSIEKDIYDYKRMKLSNEDDVCNLRDRLMLMNVDLETKIFLVDKYDSTIKMSGSDYSKGINWLKTVCKLPCGKYKQMAIDKNDSLETIKNYFDNIRLKLDSHIYGLEDVKQEILEFVARKISNPDSKGHVLALYGSAGVGKSKIIKTLSEALDWPFYQINFGGLNDVSALTGHSETYVGSKPGKLVEILTNCNYMNPIIYLDEIDKISESKSTEIFGILTHLLDEEQNNKFQDNYLSSINIDLSKAFFVLAFNDIEKIDAIVSDRLKIIYINPPSLQDKLIICQDKMIPEIMKSIKLRDTFTDDVDRRQGTFTEDDDRRRGTFTEDDDDKKEDNSTFTDDVDRRQNTFTEGTFTEDDDRLQGTLDIIISKEILEYIIVHKTVQEKGVRQLRKNIEKIFNRLNFDVLTGNYNKLKIESSGENKVLIITKTYVDNILTTSEKESRYLDMYI